MLKTQSGFILLRHNKAARVVAYGRLCLLLKLPHLLKQSVERLMEDHLTLKEVYTINRILVQAIAAPVKFD